MDIFEYERIQNSIAEQAEENLRIETFLLEDFLSGRLTNGTKIPISFKEAGVTIEQMEYSFLKVDKDTALLNADMIEWDLYSCELKQPKNYIYWDVFSIFSKEVDLEFVNGYGHKQHFYGYIGVEIERYPNDGGGYYVHFSDPDYHYYIEVVLFKNISDIPELKPVSRGNLTKAAR